MKFYAVRSGRERGVFTSWKACEASVSGYPGAKFKGFKTRQQALEYLHPNAVEGTGKPSLPTITKPVAKVRARSFVEDGSAEQAVKRRRVKPVVESGSTAGSAAKSVEAEEYIMIYTDGASRNNQNAANAVAGYGVYFGPEDPRNVAEPLDGPRQTNQRAELTAIYVALKIVFAEKSEKVRYDISTDSMYSINCVTKWSVSWQKNGWLTAAKKPVENSDLVKLCLKELAKVNKHYAEQKWEPLKFFHVRGHVGILGNEMADMLANQGCDRSHRSRLK